MNFMFRCLLFFYLSLICSYSTHASPYNFWSHWSDGKAEVNTYELKRNRYGEERKGSIHLIYVTEPFSKSKRVKVNYYDQHNPDHTIALKLNIVESWRTGVYEYRLMTSHFFDAQNHLVPLKTTFSSQEWCGISFEESTWSNKQLEIVGKSYFEGESQALSLPKPLRFTDQLLVLTRGLLVGNPKQVNLPQELIESPKQRFLTHRKPIPYQTKITFEAKQKVKTILGLISTYPLKFKLRDNQPCEINIEADAPFRIISWHCKGGEQAILIRSTRSAYWQKTRRVDELNFRKETQIGQ